MASKVHGLVGMANAEQPIADALHRLVALPLSGDGERELHRHIREAAIGHEEMPQAETMHRADEEIGRLAQAQLFQATRQFACAFLAIGDASRAPGRAHVLCHDPGELEHQRLGLAAARPGEHHTVAR